MQVLRCERGLWVQISHWSAEAPWQMYASQSKGVFKENLFVVSFSSGSLDLMAFHKNLERIVSIWRLPRMLLRSCLYRHEFTSRQVKCISASSLCRLHMFQFALGQMLRRCSWKRICSVARSTNKGYDVFLRDIIEPLEFIGLKAGKSSLIFFKFWFVLDFFISFLYLKDRTT